MKAWLPLFIILTWFVSLICLILGFALQNIVLGSFGLGFFLVSTIFLVGGIGEEGGQHK